MPFRYMLDAPHLAIFDDDFQTKGFKEVVADAGFSELGTGIDVDIAYEVLNLYSLIYSSEEGQDAEASFDVLQHALVSLADCLSFIRENKKQYCEFSQQLHIDDPTFNPPDAAVISLQYLGRCLHALLTDKKADRAFNVVSSKGKSSPRPQQVQKHLSEVDFRYHVAAMVEVVRKYNNYSGQEDIYLEVSELFDHQVPENTVIHWHRLLVKEIKCNGRRLFFLEEMLDQLANSEKQRIFAKAVLANFKECQMTYTIEDE